MLQQKTILLADRAANQQLGVNNNQQQKLESSFISCP